MSKTDDNGQTNTTYIYLAFGFIHRFIASANGGLAFVEKDRYINIHGQDSALVPKASAMQIVVWGSYDKLSEVISSS